jgi:hypothetical protein
MDFPPVPYIFVSIAPVYFWVIETYVATGEVTSLKHELRNDAVEGGVGVTKSLLASAESTEILGGFWDYIVVEVECDAAALD